MKNHANPAHFSVGMVDFRHGPDRAKTVQSGDDPTPWGLSEERPNSYLFLTSSGADHHLHPCDDADRRPVVAMQFLTRLVHSEQVVDHDIGINDRLHRDPTRL